MDLADLDPGAAQALERLGGRLELDGEMAAVVVHAQMLIEPHVARTIRAQLLEERHGLAGRLQEATRLGLQA